MFSNQEAYYRFQSKFYDLSRWAFLFGREEMHQFYPEDFTPERILEIGCGTGFHLSRLQQRFPDAEITGIDPSAAMLNKARSKTGSSSENINLVHSPYSKGAFPSDYFDMIFCSYSLTMMEDAERHLTETIQDHLRKDGLLLIADFHATPFEWFRRWMKMNYVDFRQPTFELARRHCENLHFETEKVYGGLWEYGLFAGRN